mgnify:CR=1 FL=1
MKKIVPILCFIYFVCLIMLVSCSGEQKGFRETSNEKKSVIDKYRAFYVNTYIDTITNSDSSEVRISFEWDNIDVPCPVGHIAIEDNFSQRPIQMSLYIFEQRNDSLILHNEWEDNVDTCHIRNISNDSIIIAHKNKDLFFTNRNTTVLYRKLSE